MNEIYPNVYHQYGRSSHESKSISHRDINSSGDSLQIWNFVLGCCNNCRKIKIPEEESEDYSPNKKYISYF